MYDYYDDEPVLRTGLRKRSSSEKIKTTVTDVIISGVPEDKVSLEDVKIAFLLFKKEHPEAKHCAINITEQKNAYVILLIMLDDDEKPIFKSQDTVLGQKIVTRELAENLVKFMENSESKILAL